MPSDTKERVKAFGEMMTRADFLKSVERLTTLLRRAVDAMDGRITETLRAAVARQDKDIGARLNKIEDSLPAKIKPLIPAPIKGDSPTNEQLLSLIRPLIPAPLKGDPGVDADAEMIAGRAAELTLPQALDVLQKNLPVLGTAIRDALELLQDGERPGPAIINGLEQYVVDLVKKHSTSLPAPDMGGAAVSIMHLGTVKAQTANAINFKGAGAPTTSVDAQGVVQLDFAASGGGETVLSATQTPDGSTTVFTFAAATAKPTYVYSDNTRLRPISAAGTVNWTWNSGTKQVTMQIAPQDDIYATV